MKRRLIVGVGDIHGRFHRVQDWLEQLASARGQAPDLVLAVGDVEAFVKADDHRRKAAKRAMPAEFFEYASGARALRYSIHFIGGNNEDFDSLHDRPDGFEVARGLIYLGRAGNIELSGLRIAFLSGIHAPNSLERPLEPPSNAERWKQAGYFRSHELDRLRGLRDIDLMLTHEWPRGLFARREAGGAPRRPLRAYRFPWIGNPLTRSLMDEIQPRWLWCGHSHAPFATTVRHGGGAETRVVCLDQAANPEGAIFWLELEGREAVRGGFGADGRVGWEAGAPFDERLVPADG